MMKKHQCPKCKEEELVWDNTAKKYYCLNCDKYFEKDMASGKIIIQKTLMVE